MMVINRWLTQKKKAMMIKTLRYMMLGAVLVMAGTSCSDNDEYDNPSRPVEPGDSYFSSEPVEEGPSLFDAATINTSKIPRVTSNKNTGLDEYYQLDPGDTWASVIRPERVKFFVEIPERRYDICQWGYVPDGSYGRTGRRCAY